MGTSAFAATRLRRDSLRLARRAEAAERGSGQILQPSPAIESEGGLPSRSSRWGRPPSPLRGFGTTAFVWLAEPKPRSGVAGRFCSLRLRSRAKAACRAVAPDGDVRLRPPPAS